MSTFNISFGSVTNQIIIIRNDIHVLDEIMDLTLGITNNSLEKGRKRMNMQPYDPSTHKKFARHRNP